MCYLGSKLAKYQLKYRLASHLLGTYTLMPVKNVAKDGFIFTLTTRI